MNIVIEMNRNRIIFGQINFITSLVSLCNKTFILIFLLKFFFFILYKVIQSTYLCMLYEDFMNSLRENWNVRVGYHLTLIHSVSQSVRQNLLTSYENRLLLWQCHSIRTSTCVTETFSFLYNANKQIENTITFLEKWYEMLQTASNQFRLSWFFFLHLFIIIDTHYTYIWWFYYNMEIRDTFIHVTQANACFHGNII